MSNEAKDLAEAILKIIESEDWHSGIYNFSNEGNITWYDFANEIKQLISADCKINPIPTSDYPTPAKRPANSLMNKDKIKSNFAYTPIDWRVSLKNCIQALSKG